MQVVSGRGPLPCCRTTQKGGDALLWGTLPTCPTEDQTGASVVQDPIHLALEHHRHGRLAEAALLYRGVLSEQPGHIEALHLLGVVAHQRGDQVRAIELIAQAVAGSPGNAVYHANLAEAYRALGRLDQAVACCRTALRLRPDNACAANSLGLVLLAQNQAQAAAEQFRTALRLQPGFALACNNLGNAL